MALAHFANTRIRGAKGEGHLLRVQPGEYYVTGRPDEVITTVLGSCVAACIRDPSTGYGGMNHFMLPESEAGEWGGVSAFMRYGNHAMETLINAILKTGCSRGALEIKLFGGANMYDGNNQVGDKNIRFALHYLDNEGLRVSASDLGGRFGRRIHYTPVTGKVQRLFLKSDAGARISDGETRYRSSIAAVPNDGDVELFG